MALFTLDALFCSLPIQPVAQAAAVSRPAAQKAWGAAAGLNECSLGPARRLGTASAPSKCVRARNAFCRPARRARSDASQRRSNRLWAFQAASSAVTNKLQSSHETRQLQYTGRGVFLTHVKSSVSVLWCHQNQKGSEKRRLSVERRLKAKQLHGQQVPEQRSLPLAARAVLSAHAAAAVGATAGRHAAQHCSAPVAAAAACRCLKTPTAVAAAAAARAPVTEAPAAPAALLAQPQQRRRRRRSCCLPGLLLKPLPAAAAAALWVLRHRPPHLAANTPCALSASAAAAAVAGAVGPGQRQHPRPPSPLPRLPRPLGMAACCRLRLRPQPQSLAQERAAG